MDVPLTDAIEIFRKRRQSRKEVEKPAQPKPSQPDNRPAPRPKTGKTPVAKKSGSRLAVGEDEKTPGKGIPINDNNASNEVDFDRVADRAQKMIIKNRFKRQLQDKFEHDELEKKAKGQILIWIITFIIIIVLLINGC
jgi:hypothetical protein